MSRLGNLRADWLKALFAVSQIGKACSIWDGHWINDYHNAGYLAGIGYHSLCSACKFFYIEKGFYEDSDAGCEHPMNNYDKHPRFQAMAEASWEGHGADCWGFRSGKVVSPLEYVMSKGLSWEEVENMSLYRNGFDPDYVKYSVIAIF